MNELNNKYEPLIMLVDDSEIDIYINKFFFKEVSESIEIISFTEALKALDYLINNCEDQSKIPNFIFLDIHMPIMDGFDFLEEYSNNSPNILEKCKIYILSSSFDPVDINRAKLNKFVSGFIEKPLTEEKLLRIIA